MNYTSLGYSEYKPSIRSREEIAASDASWKNAKDTILKEMECDETPLKSEYLGSFDFYYCKKYNLIVKIDNYKRQRSSLTPEEESNIRKWNPDRIVSRALF